MIIIETLNPAVLPSRKELSDLVHQLPSQVVRFGFAFYQPVPPPNYSEEELGNKSVSIASFTFKGKKGTIYLGREVSQEYVKMYGLRTTFESEQINPNCCILINYDDPLQNAAQAFENNPHNSKEFRIQEIIAKYLIANLPSFVQAGIIYDSVEEVKDPRSGDMVHPKIVYVFDTSAIRPVIKASGVK